MSAKARRALALTGIAALTATYFLLSMRPRPEAAPAETVTADTPTSESDIEPGAPVKPPADDVVAVEAEVQPREPAESLPGTGPGKIFGKVIFPADAPKTPITLEAHRVDMEAPLVTYDDTKIATITAAPDGAYAFEKLPLGHYQVYATTATQVAQGNAQPTRRRPETRLNLTLAPGGAISGRVIDANRDPIAEANVFVGASDVAGVKRNTPRDRALSSRVVTDADGRFTMGFLRLSTGNEPGYRLAVKAQGFATLLSGYIKAGTTNAELVLNEGAIVSGSLTEAGTAKAVPGQTVILESEFSFERLTGATDAEGFFFIPQVPAGTHTAALANSEFVITPASGVFEVPANAPAAEVALQVVIGGAVSGRVYDIDTNTGIAGVTVHAGNLMGAQRRKTTTANDGTYRFVGLVPSPTAVEIEKPDGYGVPKSASLAYLSLTPTSNAELSNIDFTLMRGLSISGIVVDETGKPLPGAHVSANTTDGLNNSGQRTDEQGRFTLSGFYPASQLFLYASKDEYAMPPAPRGQQPKYELTQNVSGIKLTLITTRSVSGVVVDTRGLPVKVARLVLQTTLEPPYTAGGAVSDSTGAFDFGNTVPPGEYLIGLREEHNGLVQDEANAQRITVTPDADLTRLRVVVPVVKGLTITGRVVDPRGNPVTVANVSARGKAASVDASGNFTFSGLQPGQYDVRATSSGFASSDRVSLQAGASGVVLTLKDYARIEGVVVDEHTGQPVPQFMVNYSGESNSVRDANGRFTLEKLPEYVTLIEVMAEGYASASAPLPELVAGQTLREFIVRLTPGAELTGRVTDRAGQPIAGVDINLQHKSGGLVARSTATSGPDGAFRLSSLPTGTFRLHANHRAFAPATQSVTINPGTQNQTAIALSAGASLAGTVTLNGKPVAGRVQAEISTIGGNNARTDSQGRYRIDHLSAGQAKITATAEDTGSARQKILTATLVDGATTELNIGFSSGSAALEGTLFATPGTPERSRVYVNVKWEGGGLYTQSDPEGKYRFEGLPAGEVTVQANPESMLPKVFTLQLVAGERTRRDIVFSDGATLRVDVSGLSSDRKFQPMVVLCTGRVELSELRGDTMNTLNRLTSRRLTNGTCQFTTLERGAYTVIVWELDQIAAQLGQNYIGRWTSAVIEIGEDPEQTLNLSL